MKIFVAVAKRLSGVNKHFINSKPNAVKPGGAHGSSHLVGTNTLVCRSHPNHRNRSRYEATKPPKSARSSTYGCCESYTRIYRNTVASLSLFPEHFSTLYSSKFLNTNLHRHGAKFKRSLRVQREPLCVGRGRNTHGLHGAWPWWLRCYSSIKKSPSNGKAKESKRLTRADIHP